MGAHAARLFHLRGRDWRVCARRMLLIAFRLFHGSEFGVERRESFGSREARMAGPHRRRSSGLTPRNGGAFTDAPAQNATSKEVTKVY